MITVDVCRCVDDTVKPHYSGLIGALGCPDQTK